MIFHDTAIAGDKAVYQRPPDLVISATFSRAGKRVNRTLVETAKAPRILALDALRGLSILGMALSGMVPWDSLPAWMYHAQLPPPTRKFDPETFGITWVDLVFPFFLFAMGAAIPLAIGRRLDRGESVGSVVKWIVVRGLLLGVFAYVVQHFRPLTLASNTTVGHLVSLLGFVLIVMMFVRWPDRWSSRVKIGLTAAGWVGALALLALWSFADDKVGFSSARVDIILLVLANVAVSGGLVWLFTRNSILGRLAVMGGVAAIALTAAQPGVGKLIWDFDPLGFLNLKDQEWGRYVPIFYRFEFQKYLLIVLPGTLCGDLLRRNWGDGEAAWSPGRASVLGWLGVLASVVACVGLLAREIPTTFLILTAICGACLWLASNAKAPLERLCLALTLNGTAFTLIGMLAEPLGGGIRKDSPTMSYYLVTSGLAFLALVGLIVLIDLFKRDRWLRATIECGQNPMLGYVAITNVVFALAALKVIPWDGKFTDLNNLVPVVSTHPWFLVGWGVVKTAFVAYFTAWFTRRGLFLRT